MESINRKAVIPDVFELCRDMIQRLHDAGPEGIDYFTLVELENGEEVTVSLRESHLSDEEQYYTVDVVCADTEPFPTELNLHHTEHLDALELALLLKELQQNAIEEYFARTPESEPEPISIEAHLRLRIPGYAHDRDYSEFSFGGYVVEVDGKQIPFDFNGHAYSVETCGGDILVELFTEKGMDIVFHDTESLEICGLKPGYITAKRLAQASRIHDFFVMAYVDGEEWPTTKIAQEGYFELASLSFCDGNGNAYPVAKEVIAQYNSSLVSPPTDNTSYDIRWSIYGVSSEPKLPTVEALSKLMLEENGNLYLVNYPFEVLPIPLFVPGSLYLTGSKVTSLPNDLTICGDLHLENTAVTCLPDNLHIGGNVWLCGSPITNLPDTLRVDGFLDISGTKICSVSGVAKVRSLVKAGVADE